MFKYDTVALLIAANILVLLFQLIQLYKSRRSHKRFTFTSAHMKADIGALCRGATNIDRHISTIEEKIRRLTERQEKLETTDVVKREYEKAIRAVRSGATVERLMSVHGLSQAEARLLVSLHGDEQQNMEKLSA